MTHAARIISTVSLLDLHRARKLAKRLGAQALADNITAEINRRLGA